MDMINIFAEPNHRHCISKKSPLAFFTNFFKKKKKYKEEGNDSESDTTNFHPMYSSSRVPTTLSVSVMDMRITSPCPISPALSTLTLTPGRTRDIDQDMEALRLSRRDNPFLQVLASRESLADSLMESESDDANLMSQEFPNEMDLDPLTLPEVHEHMIRSPPPTTWPRSPNFKVFQYPLFEDDSSQENFSTQSCSKKTNFRSSFDETNRQSRPASDYDDNSACVLQRPKRRSSSECRERGSNSSFVFTSNVPTRPDDRRIELNKHNIS